KRRSARNTHRKKYVDDIMLSISDDDSPKEAAPKQDTSKVSLDDAVDPAVKPNFVYINTTDEDSMVVQYILAVRKGRREVKTSIENKEAVKLQMEVKPEEKTAVVDLGEVHPESSIKNEVSSETGDKIMPQEHAVHIAGIVDLSDHAGEERRSTDFTSEKSEICIDINLSMKDSQQAEDITLSSNNSMQPSITNTNICEEKSISSKLKESPVDEMKLKSDRIREPHGAKEESSIRERFKQDTMLHGKSDMQYVEVEEYFVKYRNFSYLHCEWKTEEELFKGDKRISAKLKRFKQKMAHHANIFENLEDEPYNPDYVEVDRVLDMAEHTDPNTGKTIKHYLVKWRSMQYEDSTWELEEDVDPVKIQHYENVNKRPPKEKWKNKKKPAGDEWVKLEESPNYKNGNKLRAYQLEGLNWLLFSWYNGRNCILADEMGLGKTIQSLTFIHAVYEYGIRGPFLVIAPLSTIPNWQREFEAWTDMNVIVYHGS
ncbi:hypothetical protein ANN_20024, partial [Periplaneta americana]